MGVLLVDANHGTGLDPDWRKVGCGGGASDNGYSSLAYPTATNAVATYNASGSTVYYALANALPSGTERLTIKLGTVDADFTFVAGDVTGHSVFTYDRAGVGTPVGTAIAYVLRRAADYTYLGSSTPDPDTVIATAPAAATTGRLTFSDGTQQLVEACNGELGRPLLVPAGGGVWEQAVCMRPMLLPVGDPPYTLSFELRADTNGAAGQTATVIAEWVTDTGLAVYIGAFKTAPTGPFSGPGSFGPWTAYTADLTGIVGGEQGMLRFGVIEHTGSGSTARVRRVHITNAAAELLYGSYPIGWRYTAAEQDGAGLAPSLGEMGDATDTQLSMLTGTIVATPADAVTFWYGSSSDPAAVLSDYAAEVLADSPRLYWRLGDTAASAAASVHDSSGHGHHGKIQPSLSSPTFGAAGLVSGDPDTCATFANSAIEVPWGSWLSPSLFTVEAIIKTSLTTGNQIFLDRDDGGTGAARVFQMYRAGTTVGFYLIGSTPTSVVGSIPIADGTPHHVAVTYDGTTIKLFIDGVLDVSTASLSTPGGTPVFRVGANRSGPGGSYVIPFSGQIDEVAYYPTALSGARIAAHAALV